MGSLDPGILKPSPERLTWEVTLKLQCHGIISTQQRSRGAKGGACGTRDPIKIPRLHGGGRVTIESRSWSRRRVALVVEKEKQLILFDRPAHAAAVFVPVLHGLRPGVVIESSGVEIGVLIEFVRAAVPVVRPALGDHVDGRETVAILRGCIA